MLKSLYVKSFIIIDEIQLDFESGFSAFTGETGAGKSLLIDAISYLTGQRMEQTVIKKGASSCTIEGVFDIKDDFYCQTLLKEESIDVDDELIVLRTLNDQGKSVIRVNHRNVTLGFLKQCLEKQIDIHSQHDTHYLLNKANQINLVDEFMNDPILLEVVNNHYNDYKTIKKSYDELSDLSIQENDLEFINFQLQEIENIDPKIDEDETLTKLEKAYSGAAKTIEVINNVMSIYDDKLGLNDRLYEACKSLTIDSDEILDLKERLNAAYLEIQDIFESLSDYCSQLDVDEDEINRVQERLYEINKLKRKYGLTIEHVLNKKEDLLSKKAFILNRQGVLDDLSEKMEKAYALFELNALKLRRKRQISAKELENRVVLILKQLMLENASFKVLIEDKPPSSQGVDDVSFLISMNKNMELRLLNKVASGGERSRMMLGLKAIFTHLQGIKTIIFDEIDTGVSGPVASSIGIKMAEIGKEIQVFSVTHLAQVAACASHHYHVYKTQNDQTNTMIERLTKNRRITELALISSASDSENALAAASELLESLQKQCYE